ncbi:sensor histidine kinase [Vitiosangium sp. GDMCC 1.1324]|uniref:sensor histidine kinase n=1 Tax=Vitiosangium sp. (strain GDMCC 1.1324) TaxID=2138576 RepID=UPI000D3AAAD7|nr:sensor histidine kinase [Vitiosangium sp. GDMCC 1.1324]PTL80714.1 ATPase [Vitiosangium sp. GDMCC 1.1324]
MANRLGLVGLGLLMCCTFGGAHAAEPALTIKDFHHTAWTLKDGAPAGIWAMAQTEDGWLWLGTASGLYRFDGVVFERYDLLPAESTASRSIGALFAKRTGELWVAYSYGGASVLKDGVATHYGAREGLPKGLPIDGFEEDGDGRIWAETDKGLYVLERGVWELAGEQWGFARPGSVQMAQDGTGTLWVSADDGAYVLRRGARRFERVETDVKPGSESSLYRTNDGTLWKQDDRGFSPLRGPDVPLRSASFTETTSQHANTMVFDREGSLWSVVCAPGICRIREPHAADRPFQLGQFSGDKFKLSDGLSSDVTMTLLEDHEGNIWIGTKLGLDRFRRNDVRVVGFPEMVVYFALVPGEGGEMRTGSASRNNLPDRMWQLEPSPSPVPGFSGAVTAAYRDTDGSTLLGGPEGSWRFAGGKFTPLAVPKQEEGNRVQAITRDGAGRLWMSFRASIAYRLDGDTWTPRGGIAELPELAPARAVTDEQGRVWFGYNQNMLAIVEGNTARLFSAADGLRTGTVTAILPGPETIVGGELGMAVFDGRRFRPLAATRQDVLTGVTGLLRTRDGTLWVNGNAGAVRISADALRRALAEPDFRMPFELFDMEDGMPGAAQQIRPLPTLVEGTDGRLWFAATNGLAWMDPERIHRNARSPPVVIRSLVAGDRRYGPEAGLHLPPRTHGLKIAYSALSLSMPERVAFRYRLEGVDEDWQDPGTRREAIYTNLGPGTYRFRVIAANEDGVWNEQGAALDFEIEPTFFETRWFLALCVLAGLGVLWLLYVLRLREMTARVRQRLEERHAERERIARELHDTLLQGIQGLMLRLQAISANLPQGEHREGLERAMDRADDVLVEGRDRVRGLRASSEEIPDLAEAFAAVAREFGGSPGPVFRVAVEGATRVLNPLVADEIYRIGREALRNAFQHAGASEIEAEISYDVDELRVRIRDNGCGIAPSILNSGRPGHWGLGGMRERAEKVGARLEILSGVGRGTEVTLALSAERAYVHHRGGGWLRRLQGFR